MKSGAGRVVIALIASAMVVGCSPRPGSAVLAPPPHSKSSSVAASVPDTPAPSAVATVGDSALDGGDVRDRIGKLPKGATVGLGDPQHKQILDALRVVVERDLKQSVKFEVEKLRAAKGWAAFVGRPVRPDGGSIDYTKTRYDYFIKEGTFDEGVLALLQEKNGSWRVVEYDCGSTDSPGDSCLWDHKVPANLF